MNWGIQSAIAGVMPAVLATGLQISVCTIQSPSQAADNFGQPNLATWTDVPGLVSLKCQMAPLVELRPQDTDEIKGQAFTQEQTEFHLFLPGFYPQIEQRYRAVVDGAAYDIMGVEPDSQHIMTRLALRKREL